MAQNFVGADRGQVFLVPPSLRDWLPQDHLAWWVIDAVAEMDLSPFMRGIARKLCVRVQSDYEADGRKNRNVADNLGEWLA